MKNVYNTEQKICTLLFKGQMSMQAMVESFDGDYHLQKLKKEYSGHLFFAHRNFLKLFAAYLAILVMDGTYMSNLYNQPLLNIVGMTVSYTTFFVAVAFLKHMKEADDK